jgi:tRNA A37 methylthiotransferase MiaB
MEEDFQATCDTFGRVKFDMSFVLKYRTRPGTTSERLDIQIFQEIKEERNQILLQNRNNIRGNITKI